MGGGARRRAGGGGIPAPLAVELPCLLVRPSSPAAGWREAEDGSRSAAGPSPVIRSPRRPSPLLLRWRRPSLAPPAGARAFVPGLPSASPPPPHPPPWRAQARRRRRRPALGQGSGSGTHPLPCSRASSLPPREVGGEASRGLRRSSIDG
jgi:hypothetical protein